MTAATTPSATSQASRNTMRANRARDTGPERAVRSELHRRGLRYRTHLAPIAGLRCTPDILFTRARVAVFIDGCFWHSCPQHATSPKANGDWWARKLADNVRRDRRNDAALAAAGWTVIRCWEHEEPVACADRIEAAVRSAPGHLPAH